MSHKYFEMDFIDFFDYFLLEESFSTHSNIKHRAQSATNVLINICLKQLKLEPMLIILQYSRIVADANQLVRTYESVIEKHPEYKESVNNIKSYIQIFTNLYERVKKKPDSLLGLFFVYYCSSFINPKEHTF